MDVDLKKIVVRALVGLALAGVFYWQYSHRRRRAQLSLTSKKRP